MRNKLKIKDKETTKNGLFTLEQSGCMGACGLAPVYMINDNVLGEGSPNGIVSKINKIMEEELSEGND